MLIQEHLEDNQVVTLLVNCHQDTTFQSFSSQSAQDVEDSVFSSVNQLVLLSKACYSMMKNRKTLSGIINFSNYWSTPPCNQENLLLFASSAFRQRFTEAVEFDIRQTDTKVEVLGVEVSNISKISAKDVKVAFSRIGKDATTLSGFQTRLSKLFGLKSGRVKVK